jgi:dTMP kinase
MTFITFEGPEGAGKSTQIKALAEAIEGKGRTVVLTREPGGAPEAEELRGLLLDEEKDWSPLAEALLMNAARDAHIRRTIAPALGRGDVVLCDRFCDSTEAYQLGTDEALIAALREQVVATMPQLTLLLDLPVEVGLSRAADRGKADRFEMRGLDYHERVRERFLAIAAREPTRVVRIDANQPQPEVEKDIRAAVNARLPGLL